MTLCPVLVAASVLIAAPQEEPPRSPARNAKMGQLIDARVRLARAHLGVARSTLLKGLESEAKPHLDAARFVSRTLLDGLGGTVNVKRRPSQLPNYKRSVEAEIAEVVGDLAAVLALAGHAEDSQKTLDAIDGFGRDPAYRAVAIAQGLRGDLNAASQTIEKAFPRPYPRALTMAMVLKAHAQRGNVEDALERAKAIPDRRARFNALVNIAEVQLPAKQDALATLAAAEKIIDRLKPHDRTSHQSRLVKALATAGDIQGALFLVKSISNSNPFAVPGIKLPPNQEKAILAVAQVQARAGDWRQSLETLRPVKEPELLAKGIVDVIAARARSSDLSGARKMAAEYGRRPLAPTVEWRVTVPVREEIPVAMCESGDFEGAFKEARRLERPNALCRIAAIEAQRGNLENSLRALRRLPVKAPESRGKPYEHIAWEERLTVLAEIAGERAYHRDLKGARRAIEEIQRTVSGLE